MLVTALYGFRIFQVLRKRVHNKAPLLNEADAARMESQCNKALEKLIETLSPTRTSDTLVKYGDITPTEHLSLIEIGTVRILSLELMRPRGRCAQGHSALLTLVARVRVHACTHAAYVRQGNRIYG